LLFALCARSPGPICPPCWRSSCGGTCNGRFATWNDRSDLSLAVAVAGDGRLVCGTCAAAAPHLPRFNHAAGEGTLDEGEGVFDDFPGDVESGVECSRCGRIDDVSTVGGGDRPLCEVCVADFGVPLPQPPLPQVVPSHPMQAPAVGGSCIGCGHLGRACSQCESCGAPVEPLDGSWHYDFGWVEGPRVEGD